MKTLKTMFLSCLVLGLCSVVASCSDDDEVEEPAVLTVTYTDSTGTNLLTSGVSYNCEQNDYPTTSIEIEANKGIASLTVGITGGNDAFSAIITDLGLSSIELVGGNTTLSTAMSAFGLSFSAPASGATSYSFPIYNFYALMALYGITDSGSYHQFAINVTDAQGNTASATLKVTITEDEYTIDVTYVDEEGTDLLENGFTFNASALDYPTTSPVITASKGIASVQVAITGGNSAFTASVASFFGESGTLELVGNTTLPEIMALMGIEFASPEGGETSYEFPIAAFYQLMALFGATDADSAHTFAITVTDSRGHTYTAPSLAIQVYDLGITYYDEDGTDLLASGVSFESSDYAVYPESAINITSSNGFKSVTVKVVSGNEEFEEALALIQYIGCDLSSSDYELIGDTKLDYVMSELYGGSFTTPEANANSYEFPIASFYPLLVMFGATEEDTPHQFIINVTDNADYVISQTLNVSIYNPIELTYTHEAGTVDEDNITTSVTLEYNSTTGVATCPSDSFVCQACNGIANFEIQLTSGSSTFTAVLSSIEAQGLSLTSYYDLVSDSYLSTLLGSYGYTAPVAGETSYTVPVGAFYQLMAPMGDTTTASPKYHRITVRVTDTLGNQMVKGIRVTVNETE